MEWHVIYLERGIGLTGDRLQALNVEKNQAEPCSGLIV
jgi:hypothetical protein